MYYRLNYFHKLMSSSKELDLNLSSNILQSDSYAIEESNGQSSLVTVFSLWNTMIGSTVVAMPWAVSQAGLVLGMVVIVLVGLVSFYTCNIIVRIGFALQLNDTSDLIYQFWGKWGRLGTVLMSAVLLVGALMAYNVILNSAFYKILNGLAIWLTGDGLNGFTIQYSPLILWAILVALLNIKEKKSYIRINSKGVYFVIIVSLFMICVGIRALAINNFTTSGSSSIGNPDVHISLFGKGFLVTAGVLTLSFFLHNCVMIIMKNNQYQEHNTRDLALGFFAVGMCYFLIGVLGYLGFSGNGFPQGSISQNALDMFQPTNPFAFVIRCFLFVQMITVYPMVSFLIRAQLFGFFYGTDYPGRRALFAFSVTIASITTFITIFYPDVGTITAIFGAVCGLYFVYLTPVVMYAELSGRASAPSPPVTEDPRKLLMADSESKMYGQHVKRNEPSKMSKMLHFLIPIFGLVIVIFQFVPPDVL